MAIHVYKHSDPGAPVHPSSDRGSMAALLRACLVDGYFLGDDVASPAGWEEVFPEANNYAAFRSLVGPRQIFQIDDNQSDADVAYIRACESLSAVDAAPIGQWGEDYFGKQYSLTYNTEWTVIADERTCYVILHSLAGNIIHGFGEFTSLVPNDPYNSFCAGHGYSTNLPYVSTLDIVPLHYAEGIGISGRLETHRTTIGSFSGNGSVCTIVGAVNQIGGDVNQSSVDSANVGLGYIVSPMYHSCDYNQENGGRFIRGKLRGIFAPSAFRPEEHMAEYVDAVTGETMLAVNWQTYSYVEGQIHFQISGSW